MTGSIVPARSGVTINIELLRDGRFVKIAETRTDADGRFAMNLSYGRGNLAGYRIRAGYRVPNRAAYAVATTSHRFSRVAVLNAVVTPTTAAEVAKTYRAGCPVGRSRLSTITMNYYGTDKKMHRGVLIVRSDLTGEIKYAFSRSLGVRFPITKMVNPNAYGGNDPAADAGRQQPAASTAAPWSATSISTSMTCATGAAGESLMHTSTKSWQTCTESRTRATLADRTCQHFTAGDVPTYACTARRSRRSGPRGGHQGICRRPQGAGGVPGSPSQRVVAAGVSVRPGRLCDAGANRSISNARDRSALRRTPPHHRRGARREPRLRSQPPQRHRGATSPMRRPSGTRNTTVTENG